MVTDQTYTGPFDLEGYGNFVVSAKASKEDMSDSEESATFTLEAPLTLSQFLSQKPGTDKVIAGPLQTIWQSGDFVYVRDSAGTFGLLNGNLTAGKFATQKVIDSMTATYDSKDGKHYIVPRSFGEISDATEQIEAAEGVIADVTTENFGKYYVINGASVETFDGKNSNITIGDESVQLYNEFGLTIPTISTSAKYNVTGFVGCLNDIAQFWPIDFETVQQEFSCSFNDLTLEKGDQVELELPAEKPALDFSSDAPEIAEVVDGRVIANAIGSATISVSWAETEEWKGGSTEFIVTVTKKDSKLAWSAESATIALDNDNALPTLTIADGLDHTLSSSNSDVATVSLVDGKSIWMLKEGESIITATFPETDDYAGKTVSYNLTVTGLKPDTDKTLSNVTLAEEYVVMADEVAEFASATVAEGATVVYSVPDAVDGDPYVSLDNGKLTISAMTAGTYTLVAYVAPADNFIPSIATAKIVVKVRPAAPNNDGGNNIFTVTADEGETIWHKFVENAVQNAPLKIADNNAEVDLNDGTWTKNESETPHILTINLTKEHKTKSIMYVAEKDGAVSFPTTVNLAGFISTGVDNIIADGADAEAVYYNLQGVRVDNPAAGQLLIKVQGMKASKVLYK